jgi:hypothetical protein
MSEDGSGVMTTKPMTHLQVRNRVAKIVKAFHPCATVKGKSVGMSDLARATPFFIEIRSDDELSSDEEGAIRKLIQDYESTRDQEWDPRVLVEVKITGRAFAYSISRKE